MLLDVGGELYKSTWQTLSGSRVLQSLAVGGVEREIFIDRDGQVRQPLSSQPALHTAAWQLLCSASMAFDMLTAWPACGTPGHLRLHLAAMSPVTVPLVPGFMCHESGIPSPLRDMGAPVPVVMARGAASWPGSSSALQGCSPLLQPQS